MTIKFDSILLVATIGVPLTGLVWLVASRAVWPARLKRLAVCMAAAVSLTPTVCVVCGDRAMLPAVIISFISCSADSQTRLLGLCYGVLPILAGAGLAFSLWSFLAERRQ